MVIFDDEMKRAFMSFTQTRRAFTSFAQMGPKKMLVLSFLWLFSIMRMKRAFTSFAQTGPKGMLVELTSSIA